MRRFFSQYGAFIGVTVLAIALRIAYVWITTYGERAHDVGGHIEYIDYIWQNWSLPDRHGGWQFYQPPLYYWMSALSMLITGMFDIDREIGLRILQWKSFSMSVAVFGICIWIVRQLFDDKKQSSQIVFLGFLAVIPSLVFFAGRINNDVLYHVFAFLAIPLMYRWWKSPTMGVWILLSIVVGLGMLSKLNMVLFGPAALLIALLHSSHTWKRRMGNAAILAVITLSVAGWFHVPPFFQEEQTRSAIVGNAEQMTGPIPNTPNLLLTFNPLQVLRYPFNEISGDGARRPYVWEYTFRSMFFGEFQYDPRIKPVAVFILTLGIIMLLLALYGWIRDLIRWTHSPTFPLALLTGSSLIGALAIRITMPFSSSQDFRYSIPLLIPYAYYALYSTSKASSVIRASLMAILVFACIAFLFFLFFTDPA